MSNYLDVLKDEESERKREQDKANISLVDADDMWFSPEDQQMLTDCDERVSQAVCVQINTSLQQKHTHTRWDV